MGSETLVMVRKVLGKWCWWCPRTETCSARSCESHGMWDHWEIANLEANHHARLYHNSRHVEHDIPSYYGDVTRGAR